MTHAAISVANTCFQNSFFFFSQMPSFSTLGKSWRPKSIIFAQNGKTSMCFSNLGLHIYSIMGTHMFKGPWLDSYKVVLSSLGAIKAAPWPSPNPMGKITDSLPFSLPRKGDQARFSLSCQGRREAVFDNCCSGSQVLE